MDGLAEFKNAKWITQSYLIDERPAEGKVMAFRRDYSLRKVPDRCPLHIAAFHSCVLWINGECAYHSHIRFWVNHVSFDTIDIAPWLKQGKNAFAVVLKGPTGSAGYSEQARPSFIMKAELDEDICAESLCTDGSWRARIASWYGFDSLMISVPTTWQEHYNAYEREPADWQTGDCWHQWPGVFVAGGVGTPPFRRMSPRDIPFLTEKSTVPVCVWSGTGGVRIQSPGKNLARLFNEETLSGERCLCRGDKVYDNQQNNVYTFDFGKTAYIRPGIEVLEKSGRVRLECYYSLRFEDRPDAYLSFGFPCEGFVDTFTPAKSHCSWSALTPKGFRFLTVKAVGSGHITFRIAAKAVEYPYADMHRIQAEDTLIESIWNTAAETLRSATNDCIVDTCSRENVLWTFDALVGSKAAYYTFGELKMWRRCLRLIGEGIEEGNFKTIVPTEDSFMKLIDQNLYWIRSCKEYIDISGDREFAVQMSGRMYDLLSLCRCYITEENLFSPPEYVWHWIDWANIDRRPYSLPINCILINAAQAAYEMAASIGAEELQNLAEDVMERVRSACSRFYSEELGTFVCHIEPEGPCPEYNSFGFLPEEKLTPISIHAVLLACANGCGTEAMRQSSMDLIVQRMADAKNPEVHMGPGWMEILLKPLFENGYGAEAVAYLKKRLGEALSCGAPTFGEGFGSSPYNTAHAWGSCVNSLIARYPEAFGVSSDILSW